MKAKTRTRIRKTLGSLVIGAALAWPVSAVSYRQGLVTGYSTNTDLTSQKLSEYFAAKNPEYQELGRTDNSSLGVAILSVFFCPALFAIGYSMRSNDKDWHGRPIKK